MTTIEQTRASRPSPVRAMLRNEARLLMREPAMVIWMLIVPVVADIVLAVLPSRREPQPMFGGLSVWQAYLQMLIIFTLSIMMVQLLGTPTADAVSNGCRVGQIPWPPSGSLHGRHWAVSRVRRQRRSAS